MASSIPNDDSRVPALSAPQESAAPLPASEKHFQRLVEGATEFAMFLIDPEGRITSWNEGARRILGYEEAEVLGQSAALIFTHEDRAGGVPEKELAAAARAGRAADVRWHLRKDGSRFWADGVMERVTGAAGEFEGFAKVLRDATREKEDAQRLAESEARYRGIFEAIDVGFCVIEVLFDTQERPHDYRFFEANAAFERHTGLSNAYGRTVRELVPNLDDFWFRTYGNVALTGESVRFESHAAAMGRWFDVYALRIGPAEEHRVGLLFTDITARKNDQEALRQSEECLRESERRERLRLTEIFKQAPAFMATLRGPEHIFDLANPPYYQLVGHRDIVGKRVVEALPEVVDQGFIKLLDRVYQTGEPFVGKDVPILLQIEPAGPLEEHFVDFIYQPLFEPDGTISGILAYGVDLTDRRKLELERERLLEEQQRLLGEARARAAREALVNAVGAAISTSPSDPDAILQAALTTLGQGLGVDRCYHVRYDQAKDSARIGAEWHRAGLRPITGSVFKMSAYVVDRDPAYRAGNTHVVPDTSMYSPEEAALMQALGVGALVRVPLHIGNEMTALGVTSGEPRAWTPDDVLVMEAVAFQLQPALNVARLQQRERNIAAQLQDALIPAVPTSLPGMRLASFYRPALQEAGVGGDFFDVFGVEDGCSALIVADLSGKGLRAASEVATCRNMVRYALYTATSIADAITALNHLFVEHGLLSGFATAFLGLYDPAAQTLTYVNCGQEPGLIWRADTGEIEELGPTGPVLGGFGGGTYTKAIVTLSTGDVLALFTDGMTEVGPSRRELLEVEGVQRLLLQNCAAPPGGGHDPQTIVDCLIADVDAFARGGTGDDIALLIGVMH